MLIHHGGSAGSTAPDASDLGRMRAEAVAAELKALAAPERFELLLSSPLPPARQTASLIASALSVERPLLREELAALPAQNEGDGATEALAALQQRAWSLVEELRAQADEMATFLLVTHESTIRALVCRALSMPLSDMHRFALDPGSITTIEFRSQPRERTLLAALNETCHLEGLESAVRA